jgi:integrase
MRFPKPWFRKSTKSYYVQLHGEQHCLGSDKVEAYERYRQLITQERPPENPAKVTVVELLDKFLAWSKQEHKPDTYDWYQRFIQSFAESVGSLKVLRLKPNDVTRWLQSHKNWSSSTRRCAVIAVVCGLNWCVSEGLLEQNPIGKIKKPSPKRRERVLSRAERKTVIAAIHGAFRMFFFALGETGARPGEVASVTAEEVDWESGVWELWKHKTERTGRPRVIYLTPPMVKLCRRLIAENPTGPLFRNSQGRPWSRNAIRIRFRNLRKKLSLKGLVAYTVRHSYCTDGLERGVPIATMSELLGHSSTRMVNQHYNHLSEKREYLRRAAIQATRVGA